MTGKRFTTDNGSNEDVCLVDNLTKKEYESNFNDIVDLMNKIWEQTQRFEKHNKDLTEENEQLKSQLYCDDEEGVCNICKHHYLIKDDEAELGYYNSRCKKGHYECARVSLTYCEDFENELEE